jgi:hypothetical protein
MPAMVPTRPLVSIGISTSRAFGDEPRKRPEDRRQASFDVAGAATVKPALFDDRLERFNRHSLDGDGVLMRVEQHGCGSPRPIEPRNDVESPRQHRVQPDVEQSFA